MNCKISIGVTIVVLIYLCFFNSRENMTEEDKAKKKKLFKRRLRIKKLYPIMRDKNMTWKQQILSFLTQKGHDVTTANELYETYKRRHPDQSDKRMYMNMARNDRKLSKK